MLNIALITAIITGSFAQEGVGDRRIEKGLWQAWLESPGGLIPFRFEVPKEVPNSIASKRCDLFGPWTGLEPIEVSEIAFEGNEVTFSIGPYDSQLRGILKNNGTQIEGQWTKRRGPKDWTKLPFHGWHAQYPPWSDPSIEQADGCLGDFYRNQEWNEKLAGKWTVLFSRDSAPAIAVFDGDGNQHGTLLTATGDYGHLRGELTDSKLQLSCFDGAHAFLFKAELQDDGTLNGDFWSGDKYHDTWTARRDPEAKLPDEFSLTQWNEKAELAKLKFPDLDGIPTSLADPKFAGKARIIEVFGSWCPNCNDAAQLLKELDTKYRDKGLSIVGLAFELTGDFKRDSEQVRKFAKFHGITYPILVGGLSDKDEASKAIPLLERVKAYPTTIFLHSDGRVRAVHTGFSGPATGKEYDKLRRDFERRIEELLSDETEGALIDPKQIP